MRWWLKVWALCIWHNRFLLSNPPTVYLCFYWTMTWLCSSWISLPMTGMLFFILLWVILDPIALNLAVYHSQSLGYLSFWAHISPDQYYYHFRLKNFLLLEIGSILDRTDCPVTFSAPSKEIPPVQQLKMSPNVARCPPREKNVHSWDFPWPPPLFRLKAVPLRSKQGHFV